IDRAVRRASDEVVGEVRAPAEADTYPAGKMPMGFLDRFDIHGVGKDQKLFLRVLSLLFPPGDDFLAGGDRRRAVRPKAGPVRNPFRRVTQESLGAEGIGQ